MKKILILLLLCIVPVFAFGEFSVELWGDIAPDLLQIMTPIGDAGDPSNANGVPYFGTSRVDFFTGGVFRAHNLESINPASGGLMDVNRLFLRLAYDGGFFDARLRINGNRLSAWGLGLFAPSEPERRTPVFIENTLTFSNFLHIFADQYRVRFDIGSFRIWFGNEDIGANMGRVAPLNNHSPALFAKVDIMGPTLPTRINSIFRTNPVGNVNSTNFFQIPGPYGGFGFASINSRDPRRTIRSASGTFNQGENEDPYFLLTYTHQKLDFAIGTHLQGPDPRIGVEGDPPYSWDFLSYLELAGYFRVSGNRMFDLLTFDLVYRLQGGNRSLDDLDPDEYYAHLVHRHDPEPQPTRKHDAEGSIGHTIALFVQPFLNPIINGLNVTAGYSLTFQTLEKIDPYYNGNDFFRGVDYDDVFIVDPYDPSRFDYDNTKELKRKAPFFHGIDLRANYSGISNFLFTTQNNISFASISGSNTTVIYSLRPNGAYNANADWANPYVKDGESDNWLYLYNTLGVRYTLSPEISFFAGVANRHGILTEVRNRDGSFETARFTNNWFSGELMTMYMLPGTGWEIWAGLAMLHQYSTYENSTTGNTASSGRLTLAIPLRIMWSLRK